MYLMYNVKPTPLTLPPTPASNHILYYAYFGCNADHVLGPRGKSFLFGFIIFMLIIFSHVDDPSFTMHSNPRHFLALNTSLCPPSITKKAKTPSSCLSQKKKTTKHPNGQQKQGSNHRCNWLLRRIHGCSQRKSWAFHICSSKRKHSFQSGEGKNY